MKKIMLLLILKKKGKYFVPSGLAFLGQTLHCSANKKTNKVLLRGGLSTEVVDK